jgi:hypothetical protein
MLQRTVPAGAKQFASDLCVEFDLIYKLTDGNEVSTSTTPLPSQDLL